MVEKVVIGRKTEKVGKIEVGSMEMKESEVGRTEMIE